MNQRTHSWIAVRAIALLEDENTERNLVRLLKPHVRKASVGAWIPDQVDAIAVFPQHLDEVGRAEEVLDA